MNEEMVLLWGDIGVGKTTLLASGLMENREKFPEIDWNQTADDIEPVLLPIWRKLRNNERPPGTNEVNRFRLTLKGSPAVEFVDVPGGLSRVSEGSEAAEQVKNASAVLFIMEWNARERIRQFDAIENVLHRLPERARSRTGLAFTKCELAMPERDQVWQKSCINPGGGWWRSLLRWRPEEERILDKLMAAWPTSVYGFHSETRQPACILDEFGELIPFQIAPRNVAEVISWYLKGGGL